MKVVCKAAASPSQQEVVFLTGFFTAPIFFAYCFADAEIFVE
jgi:hypothetical protein